MIIVKYMGSMFCDRFPLDFRGVLPSGNCSRLGYHWQLLPENHQVLRSGRTWKEYKLKVPDSQEISSCE